MRTYSGHITHLKDNQIFVFGSNTEGRHGKGAALWAHLHAGAKYGQARGIQGSSYAIVTKDLRAILHPSVQPVVIIREIADMYLFAQGYLNKDFLVAYGTSPNLNGYSPKAMAAMFYLAGPIPDNVIFGEQFSKLINDLK